MAQFLYGDRIGATAKLSPSCAAIIFDDARERILLTRRMDNGRWCLPGGMMDAGESAIECAIREVWEETGLRVRIDRLIGIYTTPHRITVYADGNRFQFAAMTFEATITGGKMGFSDETTEIDWFTPDEIAEIDLMGSHVERIEDALAEQAAAFIR